MAWNGSFRPNGATSSPTEDPISFRAIYDNYDSFPVTELKREFGTSSIMMGVVPCNDGGSSCCCKKSNNNEHDVKNSNGGEKKRRLTVDQIECLEKSFQEEIKLEPERKLRLAHHLGLHPRQVAVWFQNRRARWKAKQLERVYDALKQEYNVVSREKQRLQEEVMKLKAELEDRAAKEGSTTCGYGEASAEETVESGGDRDGGGKRLLEGSSGVVVETATMECNYCYYWNVDDFNNPPTSFEGVWPGCQ